MMKQLGDITHINGSSIKSVNIITFGSPCTNISQAGDKTGLSGTQSSLFFEAIRTIREMRKATGGKYPRFIIFENVKAILTSNKGYDFARVLSEITETSIPVPKDGRWATCGMAELPGCNLAWRVFDAEEFDLPQHRERMFLVADFTGQSAREILFRQERLSRDNQENGSKRKITTNDIDKLIEKTGSRKPVTLQVRQPRQIGKGGTGALFQYDKSATLGTHNIQILFVPRADGLYDARRLTPVEFERLMGFNDDWTIGISDTARYKALGNSIAVPCVDYIMQGIMLVLRKENNERKSI